MKTKIALGLLTATSAFCVIFFFGAEQALIERHPTIDPRLVRKAHRIMVRRALTGELSGTLEMSDEELDIVLLQVIELELL